jgi:hypothetical protein
MWSRKARRLSGAAKTPKRCWIQFPKDSVSGLRDRALIAAMLYSFARVSAVLNSKSTITIIMACVARMVPTAALRQGLEAFTNSRQ